jgi:protein CpxP
MTKRVLIAAGLAAALISGGALVLAQSAEGPGAHGPRGPRGGPGGRMEFGLRGIELTDAQRQQVQTIMASHRDELQQVGEKVREAHRAFAQATSAETIDEAAIRTASTVVASAMADEGILRARIRSEVNGILTAEQREQLKTRQQERGTRKRQGR